MSKTVLLGVTGCIAAYKACEILRGLQKAGVHVKVVMTEHATHFVGSTTFRALTKEPVAVSLFDEPGDPIHHISLAQEADLFLIAPCTANVMAKLAWGIADDLLTTTALATHAPVLIAPAMNVNMYEHPITQENIQKLVSLGVKFVEPEAGYLACGDVGRGRLAEPSDIVKATLEMLQSIPEPKPECVSNVPEVAGTRLQENVELEEYMIGDFSGKPKQDFAGKHVMVTAGATIEPIDPVRFISNHSSGKMGYALARAAAERGAKVVLISGKATEEPPLGVRFEQVQTAEEMKELADMTFPGADVGVFCAAVADMRPKSVSSVKLKKGIDDAALQTIELVPNPDILASCASVKKKNQIVVGFAAETSSSPEDLVAKAQVKLATKQADMIVANDVSKGKTFGSDTIKAYLVQKGSVLGLPEMPKEDLANAILDAVLEIEKAG